MPSKTVEFNADFKQLDLPLDITLGRGERVLKHARLEANSKKSAWYELFMIKIPHGFLVEKVSGAEGCGRQREAWFRRDRTEADKKYDNILKDKTNPERRSPRKYYIATSQADSSVAA